MRAEPAARRGGSAAARSGPAERDGAAVSRLQIAAAAALFSTGGMAIKSTSLGGWEVASLRSGVAAAALLVALPAARRGWSWRSAVVGAAYAATMVLYVLANKATTAASAIFLQSTAPLYILVLGPWLLDEPVRRRDLGFLLALAVGLIAFFVGLDAPVATAPRPFEGNLAAAGAGFFWALTVVGLRWLGRDPRQASGAASSVACGNLVAFLAALPLAWPLTASGWHDWRWIVYLGVFQVALAYVFLTRGIVRLSALEAALLLLLEPVLNPFWAWWAHGEVPGPWVLVGGGTIVGATAIKSWVDARWPSARG